LIKRLKSSVLFQNTFIYTLTEVINKAIPFLLLPILTIYLSPSDYGIVATFGAFSGILAVFIHLGMNGAINVNFFNLSKQQLKIYIFNTLIVVSIATSIAFIFVLTFQEILSAQLEIPKIWLVVGVVLAFSQFVTAVNLNLWQFEQKPKSYGVYQVLGMLTNVSIVLILVVWLGMKWEGQLIGLAITKILFSIGSFGFIYKRGYLLFKIKKDYIEDALKFGVPLIPHVLSGWFRTGIDRILLTTIISTSATGLYAVGYQFGLIVGIIATAFNQAYVPYLYKKLTSIDMYGKRKLVKFTYICFFAYLMFATLISLTMPWLIENFLNEKYHSAGEFIPLISFGYAFHGMYLMVVNYIFYMKKTVVLSLITFTSGLLHAILSYLLITFHGAIGAAEATIISFFILFITVWLWSTKVYEMPWTLKSNVS